MKIEELGLTTRVKHSLFRIQVKTVSSLLNCSKQFLLGKCLGIGTLAIAEIEEALDKHGLKLIGGKVINNPENEETKSIKQLSEDIVEHPKKYGSLTISDAFNKILLKALLKDSHRSNQRLRYAEKAMQAIIPTHSYVSMTWRETLYYNSQIAKRSFEMADEMMLTALMPSEELKPIGKVVINQEAFNQAMNEYKQKYGEKEFREYDIESILQSYLNKDRK